MYTRNKISQEHSLNYFLPDDGELGGGMYLASAYKYFINLQNGFINNLVNFIGPNSLLKSYLSQLNQEIKIQEAKIALKLSNIKSLH